MSFTAMQERSTGMQSRGAADAGAAAPAAPAAPAARSVAAAVEAMVRFMEDLPQLSTVRHGGQRYEE
jgi:hypothetical protein